ncbi:MAG: 50S ribosomal protein L31 [Candidatus Levybacteria bacterium]|nr:50S ribosomal protein L31 [Candidatus Levybacteria bacterium]
MKASIHPQYFKAQVTCACGNRFTVSSTIEIIHVELCNKCHPFYTGEQRFVDAASRIQKFQAKQAAGKAYVPKKVKLAQKEKKPDQPQSLREMLANLK